MAKEKDAPAEAGHNSADARLVSFIQRIERLMEEKAILGADIKEVFSEAKLTGFDAKTMRQVIKLRAMEPAAREEQDHLLELYRRAVGLDLV
jgi:uncharacterized protein (UPF0335 family)